MRIVIADDEQDIREYIAAIPQWGELGCEITGTAANGMEVLAILERCQVDLIITDIRMPVLDGLGLAERVRATNPSLPIIFLTAYHEFDYARRAVKLGIADFITKPFRPEDLVESVRLLQAERGHLADWRTHDYFFALFGNWAETEERKQAWLAAHGIMDGPCVLLYAEWDRTAAMLAEKASFAHIQLRSRIAHAAEASGLSAMTASGGKGVYLCIRFGPDQSEACREAVLSLAKWIAGSAGSDDDPVSVGISGVFATLLHLPDAMRQVSRCMEYRMLLGRKSVIAFDAIDSMPDRREPETADAANRLGDLLRVADSEAIRALLKESYRSMLASGFGKREMQHFCLQLIDKADAVVREFGIAPDPAQYVHIRETILTISILTDLMKALEHELAGFAEAVRHRLAQSTNRLTADVLRMIRDEYTSDLTLQEASVRLNVNYSHLSRLIKKETGRNFSALLWERRIEAAKTILLNEDMKAYEVAYAVGFKDTTHFSQLFKKMTGSTPGAYKARMLAESNGGKI